MTKQHATFVGDPADLSEFASRHLLMDRAFGTLNAVELDTFYIKAFHALDHEDGLVMDHATFWRHDREDGIYLALAHEREELDFVFVSEERWLEGPDPEND